VSEGHNKSFFERITPDLFEKQLFMDRDRFWARGLSLEQGDGYIPPTEERTHRKY
jgi:hypothetical protein